MQASPHRSADTRGRATPGPFRWRPSWSSKLLVGDRSQQNTQAEERSVPAGPLRAGDFSKVEGNGNQKRVPDESCFGNSVGLANPGGSRRYGLIWPCCREITIDA